ncbi:MAG: hypothetical protein IKZ87_04610 [Actinomycetaceae bacterium]|nr:hypothetical protein [Actinomycetaceae bacterium]
MPEEERALVRERAAELRTLRDLRLAVEQTQQQLASQQTVGNDSVFCMENCDDPLLPLLSTLRRNIESMGGTLELVAKFPNKPAMLINRLGTGATQKDLKNET